MLYSEQPFNLTDVYIFTQSPLPEADAILQSNIRLYLFHNIWVRPDNAFLFSMGVNSIENKCLVVKLNIADFRCPILLIESSIKLLQVCISKENFITCFVTYKL